MSNKVCPVSTVTHSHAIIYIHKLWELSNDLMEGHFKYILICDFTPRILKNHEKRFYLILECVLFMLRVQGLREKTNMNEYIIL